MTRKMLYFGPSGIGDWCFIYPSLLRLMKAYDCDEIHIIVPYRNSGNELLAQHPYVKSLKWLNRKTTLGGLFSYLTHWVTLLLWIRSQKFDTLAVSYLSNQPDFLLLAALSGITTRVGKDTHAPLQSRAFTKIIQMPETAGKVAIHAAYSQDCSNHVESDIDTTPLFGENLYNGWQEKIKSLGLQRPYIALGIGGGRNAGWRFWPAENYRQLILDHPHIQFALLGGGEDDYAQALNIMKSGLDNAINLVNRTTFTEGLQVIRGARLVIGNDSGICNISATLNISTICLYGPSNPSITGPALIGAKPLAIDMPCAPCFDDKQDPSIALQCSHRDCLNKLSPAIVSPLIEECFGDSTDIKTET